MKRESFCRVYQTEADAMNRCRSKNRAFAAAGNKRDVAAIVEHPEGWAVMDLRSAIATELPYRWIV